MRVNWLVFAIALAFLCVVLSFLALGALCYWYFATLVRP